MITPLYEKLVGKALHGLIPAEHMKVKSIDVREDGVWKSVSFKPASERRSPTIAAFELDVKINAEITGTRLYGEVNDDRFLIADMQHEAIIRSNPVDEFIVNIQF